MAAPATHLEIDRSLCGEPVELTEGMARVSLLTVPAMRADATGLVHGGFVFGLADYAAMLAVNHPHVVLAAAETRFLAPVVVGERLVAQARVEETSGRRRKVGVTVARAGETRPVFTGTFDCAVLDRPILTPPPAGGAG